MVIVEEIWSLFVFLFNNYDIIIKVVIINQLNNPAEHKKAKLNLK